MSNVALHPVAKGGAVIALPALAALLFTVVSWASAFPGIRLALSAYEPSHVALLRYGTASTLLAVFAIVTRMGLPRRCDVLPIAAVGFVGITAYNLALAYGQ